MSEVRKPNEISGKITRATNGHEGFEVQFFDKASGKLLRKDELPEGLMETMLKNHWLYLRGGKNKDGSWREQKFYNTSATKNDLKFFTSGEYLKGCKKSNKKSEPGKATATAPKKSNAKTSSKKSEPAKPDYSKMTKAQLLELLAQLA